MKDVTSTSFGLLIAFLLPGMAVLYATSFVSPVSNQVLDSFLTASADVGLFFIIMLVSLAMGLMITALRWKVFEVWFCSGECLKTEDFMKLGGQDNVLESFKAAVDEHYRYHQFWGGMTLVLPLIFVGWTYNSIQSQNYWTALSILLAGIFVEYIAYQAAREALNRYYLRANSILGGGQCPTGGGKN